MKISIEKVKAMILYFAGHTDPKFFGKTKLMKLFYFTDFGYVKRHGLPVTFDRYKNMEHGPVPMTIYSLMSTAHDEPDESLLADILEFQDVNGMQKIIARKEFTEREERLFSPAELKMMAEVCQRFYNANKREIETASHKESPWSNTALLEDIPYKLATNDKDSETTEEEVDLMMKILK